MSERKRAAISHMARLRTVLGVVVVAVSMASMLALLVQNGFTRQSAALFAFFLAATYAGVQLARASHRNEREHEQELGQMLDESKRAPPRSDRAGGPDAPDQRG